MTIPLPPAAHLGVQPVPYANSVGKRLRNEQFGVVVSGVRDINHVSSEEFQVCVRASASTFPAKRPNAKSPCSLSQRRIEQLLYKHGVVVFEDVDLTPAGQWALTGAFDPAAVEYGHGPVGRPDNRVSRLQFSGVSGSPR